MPVRLGYKLCCDCAKEIKKSGSRKRCEPCQIKHRREAEKHYECRHKPPKPPRILKCDICGCDFAVKRARQRVCGKQSCISEMELIRHRMYNAQTYEKNLAKAKAQGRLDDFLRRSAISKSSVKKWVPVRENVPERVVSHRIVARHCCYLSGPKLERRVNELLEEYFNG